MAGQSVSKRIKAVAFAIRYVDGTVDTAVAEGPQRIDIAHKIDFDDLKDFQPTPESRRETLTLKCSRVEWFHTGSEDEKAITDGGD